MLWPSSNCSVTILIIFFQEITKDNQIQNSESRTHAYSSGRRLELYILRFNFFLSPGHSKFHKYVSSSYMFVNDVKAIRYNAIGFVEFVRYWLSEVWWKTRGAISQKFFAWTDSWVTFFSPVCVIAFRDLY